MQYFKIREGIEEQVEKFFQLMILNEGIAVAVSENIILYSDPFYEENSGLYWFQKDGIYSYKGDKICKLNINLKDNWKELTAKYNKGVEN